MSDDVATIVEALRSNAYGDPTDDRYEVLRALRCAMATCLERANDESSTDAQRAEWVSKLAYTVSSYSQARPERWARKNSETVGPDDLDALLDRIR